MFAVTDCWISLILLQVVSVASGSQTLKDAISRVSMYPESHADMYPKMRPCVIGLLICQQRITLSALR